MRSFVLRIIVIECCSARGFPLEEVSKHYFLSIKVLFWCCGFIYCVVPLLFSAIFIFSAIIIDMVPYKWYQSTFLSRKLWVIVFQGVIAPMLLCHGLTLFPMLARIFPKGPLKNHLKNTF
jgi:hypothetical protein